VPLTPTDVANKQFRIAFRGYSLDEVDAFLDEVENELSRLLRENSDLRNRPAPAAPSGPAALPAAEQQQPPPAAALSGMEGQEAALRTLLLAQRTADEAIAEARAEADEMLSSARQEADRTLSSARAEAERTLGSAQQRAARLDEEVAAKIQEATGDLEMRRRALEGRIDELRAFEREYRTRLKAYLETQLRELDSGAPDDGGAGVPAGARAAAVGGGAPDRGQPARPGPGAAPARPDQPDGPPREAEGGPARAVPPLASPGPEPVGPFTVVPSGGDARGGGPVGGHGGGRGDEGRSEGER
jgi:DivIVA domain-containing protein